MPSQWSNWSGVCASPRRGCRAGRRRRADCPRRSVRPRQAEPSARSAPVTPRPSSSPPTTSWLHSITASRRSFQRKRPGPSAGDCQTGNDAGGVGARSGPDWSGLLESGRRRHADGGRCRALAHGSGRDLPAAAHLVGGRLVTGTGEIVEFGEDDVKVLRAARVSLGALGIMTQLRLSSSRRTPSSGVSTARRWTRSAAPRPADRGEPRLRLLLVSA